jgi:hypothetical protein
VRQEKVYHDNKLHLYYSWGICFQRTILYGCNFANGYDINTQQMSSFYVTSCGQMKMFYTWECVWAQDNPQAIRELGYQVHFSVGIWTGIIGDTFVGSHLLPGAG